MKSELHPKWFPEANVTCASCGRTWQTGATQKEIRTDICSNCHPFYTGQQRIVDTEGRVDVFMRRLKRRDEMLADVEAREASKTPMTLSIDELGLSDRYVAILQENGINTVSDFLDKLSQNGEDSLLEMPGMGRKALADMKKTLRNRGYELPVAE